MPDIRIPFDVTKLDYSTLDLERIRSRLPRYSLPPTYRLDSTAGTFCAGDPPGYPSYFLYNVWTQHGNHPPMGQPRYVFVVPTDETRTRFELRALPSGASLSGDKTSALLRSVYQPLAEDHPRVQVWERGIYAHMRNGYEHPTEQESGRAASFFMTDGQLASYHKALPPRPRRLETDHDALWAEKLAQWEADTEAVHALYRSYATPERHLAVIAIRRYYPDHEPRLDWIENAPVINHNEEAAEWFAWYAEPVPVIPLAERKGYAHNGVGNDRNGLELYARAYGPQAVADARKA